MMRSDPSSAERLDSAVAAVLAGEPPAVAAAGAAVDRVMRPLLEVAVLLRTALAPPPMSSRFEARLGARLAHATPLEKGVRSLRHPGRLLVAGAAVSSAAVGVGVTAYAVWRSSRRSGAGHRVHR